MTDRMGSVPNLYVYAVDRKDVMAIRAELIAAAAARTSTPAPFIRIIKSARDRDNIRSDETRHVRQDIARVPDTLPHGCNHAIIIITHEALKSTDWAPFTGWQLIVDEVPTVWDHEERMTPAHVAHFQAHYDLTRINGTTFSVVTAKAGAVTLAAYQHDDALSTWSTFHKRVESDHGVYVDIHDWAEMALPDTKWTWYSMWEVHELRPFRSVTIVANAFEQSVTAKLIESLFADPLDPDHRVEFVFDTPAPTAPSWAPRQVRILYFAADHVAGSHKWTDRDGPYFGHHDKWADWIGANTGAEGHYWAANNVNRTAWANRIPGAGVSPKIAGSNEYRDMTTCSVCYTAKGGDKEAGALKLFGIDREVITRSREYEDLIQIVFRSSLRMRDDTRDVELRVYDRAQAEFISAYFKTSGFQFEIELRHVDIGLDDVVRKSRKEHDFDRALAACLTEDERHEKAAWMLMTPAQKAAKRRADKRAEDIAAGKPVRSRGRPKKVA